MRQIVVELDRGWVFKHRADDILPVDKIESLLGERGIHCKESLLTGFTVLVRGDRDVADQIASVIKTSFFDAYKDENLDGVMSLEITEIDDDVNLDADEYPEVLGQSEATGSDPFDMQELLDLLESREDSSEGSKDEIARINKTLSTLVGANEFKSLINEIIKIAPKLIEDETQEVFNSRCYIFSIGDGYGLSTYLDLFARTLSATGLCPMSSHPVIEERLGPYRESEEPFESVFGTMRYGSEDSMRVMCIDIREWIGRTDNHYFKAMLRQIERKANEYIVVFRVPFLEKDVLANLNYSLSDLLSVKTISFPPLSQNELDTYATREIKSYGFSVAKNAWEPFHARIMEEKGDGKFYGLNTVKKVVRELIYNKQLANAGKKKSSYTINCNDTRMLCTDIDQSLSGMEQLKRLVGHEQIKQKVEELIAQIELSTQQSGGDRPCIHMRFVGNAGTGKTTVARIIGKILKEKGVLRVGNFYEYAGRDLCGRYIGETAPKTTNICRDAYGSVLFIDEAYSLYRGDDNVRDYGREAIDTLIAEMENHRSDFVVIMAGYTDDMDKLMSANQGLASRMPYTIEFPNFTREQLYEIYVSMVKARFKYDDKLLEVAHAYFMSLTDETINAKEFSNARFVRNLFERTWAKAAMRKQLTNATDIVLTKDDFDHACAEKDFAFNNKKKFRIGF